MSWMVWRIVDIKVVYVIKIFDKIILVNSVGWIEMVKKLLIIKGNESILWFFEVILILWLRRKKNNGWERCKK